MAPPFNTVLAANRAEIAVRIMRAAAELNMRTVAVYGYEDRNSAHRWGADQSFLLPAASTPVGAYLDPPLLAAHDTFSPLNPPFYNAGPFMVYRNAPAVNALFRKSARWQQVASSGEYMAFDEWWGPKLIGEHMPAVIEREAKAGRVRAYACDAAHDRKVWMQDDFEYTTDGAFGEGDRFYNDALLVTWRRGADGLGRLWYGPGTDATADLWDGNQGQRALLHLLGSKYKAPLGKLVATDHLRRLAAHASEVRVTRHGLWLKVNSDGRMHTWYSGRFPGAHMLMRSSELARAMGRLFALGKPTAEGSLAAAAEALLPCIKSARAAPSRATSARSCRAAPPTRCCTTPTPRGGRGSSPPPRTPSTPSASSR